MKGFSIITDFGCNTNCEYCIWKKVNKNYSSKDNISQILITLKNELINRKLNKFSISGGGDPFNNIENNMYFWNNIFDICDDMNIKFDVHTSYNNFIQTIDNIFYNNLKSYMNKIVLHSSIHRFNKTNIESISSKFNTRINFVITNDLSIEFLKYVEKISIDNNIQLSYRELVCYDKLMPNKNILNFCKHISDRYCNGKFVYQNDYNDYLMPDGKVYQKYLK